MSINFRKISSHFNGTDFISIGPKILTRSLEEICQTTNRTLWTRKRCLGIKLQPKELFYPIQYTEIYQYFDPDELNEVLKITENSTTIHIWNDQSKSAWGRVGIKNAYQVIAQQHCPQIYSNSEYF